MAMCNSKLLKQSADKTFKEVIYKLKNGGKATAVRPTGFGKTFMLARLANEYGKVLYIYPLHIIKKQVQREYAEQVNGAEFMTYMALANSLGNNELENMSNKQINEIKESKVFKGVKLLIFDEMHMMGALKTRKAIENLLKLFPNTPRVGVTATVNRTDGFDFIGEFFGWDSLISTYTIKDAIEDGIMQKPYYVKAQFDILKQNKEPIKAIKKLAKDGVIERQAIQKIDAELHRISECVNTYEAIRNNIINCYNGEPPYMKFLIFYQDRALLTDKQDEVANWFRKAFPHKKVNTMRITSDTAEYRNNIEELDNLEVRDGVIDLVMCIDMLNMGYHVDSVTGVMMLRTTRSNIVYKQQIGRCMSVTRKDRPLIFDLVNNIEIEACVLLDEAKERENNNNTIGDTNRLDKTCIEMHDLTVEVKEFLDRIEELSVRDRVNKAVEYYVSYYMPFGECWKKFQVRPKYLAKRIIELIESGRLTKIITVGGNIEVVKCDDLTVDMVKADYVNYMQELKNKK
jgi:superfamily II DNA or RNA helicase